MPGSCIVHQSLGTDALHKVHYSNVSTFVRLVRFCYFFLLWLILPFDSHYTGQQVLADIPSITV